MRVVGVELTEALCYDNSVPGGRDSRQFGGTAAVPQIREDQETIMERDEIELIAILRQRPDLIGLAWRLIAEAKERSGARGREAHGKPVSA